MGWYSQGTKKQIKKKKTTQEFYTQQSYPLEKNERQW